MMPPRMLAPGAQSLELSTGRSWRWALRLHAGYLALFTLWTAWTSSAYPKFVEELRVPVWPPAAPFGVWLERVLLLPLYRYDVIWYVGIAEHGYGATRGDTAFHPLYPLLVGVAGRLLGGHFLLAAWLVALVCCVALLALLFQLISLDHEPAVARRATLFLLGSPLGFAFLLPYGESLLLLCIVGALLAARQQRWWLAGLLAAAAVLTKQPGGFVLPALLWELWQQHRAAGERVQFSRMVRALAPLALAPLALVAWAAYRATIEAGGFVWRTPLELLSGIVLSPAYERVWGHHLEWPGAVFLLAARRFEQEPQLYLLLNIMLVLIMSVLALYVCTRTRPSYAIYGLLVLVLRLAVVYPLLPLMAAARHLTLIFPLFTQLALWGRSRAITALVLVINALLWVLISSMVVRNAFIP